jgi:hypothetical protein
MQQIPLPLVQLPLRWRQADDFWHLVAGDETVAYLHPEAPPSPETWGQQIYVIWLSPDDWSREAVEIWQDGEVSPLEYGQDLLGDLWSSEGRPRLVKGTVRP